MTGQPHLRQCAADHQPIDVRDDVVPDAGQGIGHAAEYILILLYDL